MIGVLMVTAGAVLGGPARYLVGAALVGAGDLSGCKFLRTSGLPAATRRAAAAGCP